MRKHNSSALEIARFLEAHPKVKFVRYPGLESHPRHSVARRQTSGFGGMIYFGLHAEGPLYFRFLENLNIITHAVCLGHAESLIQFYPRDGDHPELGVLNYPEDIGAGVLRFSVGLEEPADLIADLSQALEAIPARSVPSAIS